MVGQQLGIRFSFPNHRLGSQALVVLARILQLRAISLAKSNKSGANGARFSNDSSQNRLQIWPVMSGKPRNWMRQATGPGLHNVPLIQESGDTYWSEKLSKVHYHAAMEQLCGPLKCSEF